MTLKEEMHIDSLPAEGYIWFILNWSRDSLFENIIQIEAI